MEKIQHSEAEWRAKLSPEQYRVLREKGTEPPFDNSYWNNHDEGTFVCGACGLPLFTSETKYDSGTGWPSFWAPIDQAHVAFEGDTSHGMTRDEVVCARCGSHLGHIFTDGPQPTGERYCMNSLSLNLQPGTGSTEDTKQHS